MTDHVVSVIILVLLILLIGAALLGAMSRRYRRKLGMQKEPEEKTGETAFIINAFHEVTKQLKEKEKELERLKALAEQRAENIESYNENILQCVTSGVMTFDPYCVLTTINRAAEEVLGMEREQALGTSCRDLFGAGEILEAVQDTLGKKAPPPRMEAVLERPSGKVWLGFNTAALTDRRGDALGVILSFTDLTEVKRLQEQMELKERLTALGEMSAGIAHELRNPMAVISGYLNLLTKKADPSSKETIRSISKEIDGMNRIIGDLLTFARPASLNRVKVNIRDLLESCLENAFQVTGADARTATALKLDDIDASVDEVLMRQAFTNLIQNAIEAMPEGGTLAVEAVRSNNEIVVVVRDSGGGISRDNLKKIFLPFFTTKDKGTGLGLALVHKIILSHSGHIEVESKEGSGTLFRVVFPLR
jgi:PAS domain S-box-containing protein